MKVIEAINQIDNLKPNTYSDEEKTAWLSRLDYLVKREILDTHEGGTILFGGYDADADAQTGLMVPPPYDEMYLRWLEAQIDYANGEYSKYNNSIEMFNASYRGYSNYYNRTHAPKGGKLKYF